MDLTVQLGSVGIKPQSFVSMRGNLDVDSERN